MLRRRKERVTFRCELHASINVAEVQVNHLIRRLWGDKWLPTLHRTKITATKPERTGGGKGDDQYRTVVFYFAGLPYASAEVMAWKWGDQPWHADGAPVTLTPNPDLADKEPQLEKGPIVVREELDGELRIYNQAEWELRSQWMFL